MIVVMAKEPRVGGGVKTRVGLGEGERVELYRAFLEDKVEQVCSVGAACVAFWPPEAAGVFEALFGDRVRLIAQRGADLGERLLNVARDVLGGGGGGGGGAGGVLIVDSDTPNLPSEVLVEALGALETADVVLGPAWDGGYYLIGLSQPHAALFDGVPWSTADVLSRTVAAAEGLGLTIHFLPAWYDVDTPADLDRLAGDLVRATPLRPGFPSRTTSEPRRSAVAGLGTCKEGRLAGAGVPNTFPSRTAEVVGRLRGAVKEDVPRNELWRTLSTRPVYQNRWMRVDESVVDMGEGRLTLYGVVTCSGCVGIVPLLPDGRVVLVRQFRYVARRHTWEIPTGGIHAGESIEDAAHRELGEETGYQAGRLRHLSTFHTSKSIVDEVAHLYVGEDLTAGTARPDETEQLEVRPFAFEAALEMVLSGEIVDGMSVVGLLTLARAIDVTA